MYRITHADGKTETLRSKRELNDAVDLTLTQFGAIEGGKEVEVSSFLGIVKIRKMRK